MNKRNLTLFVLLLLLCPAFLQAQNFKIASHDRTDYCKRISISNNLATADQLIKLIDNDPSTELNIQNIDIDVEDAQVLNIQSIQIDFEVPTKISGYSLSVNGNVPLWWEVYGYANESDAKVNANGTSLDQRQRWINNETLIFDFGAPQEFKSIVLWIFKNFGSHELRLSEFQLFGYESDLRESITNTPGGQVTASRGDFGWANQGCAQLIDKNINSKALFTNDSNPICPFWIKYENPTAASINKYTLTSAEDAPDRNLKSWILQGSNTGGNGDEEWTNLDTRQNQEFGGFYNTMEYSIPVTQAYKYFRLYVNEIAGPDNTICQMAEWQLFLEPLKVACVGNSITEGWVYPAHLQNLFGTDNYIVRNYGASGHTLSKNSDASYWRNENTKYVEALMWHPDIIIIKLGTNDTKPQYWTVYGSEYEADYMDFVASFQNNLANNPEIHLCYPLYLVPGNLLGGTPGACSNDIITDYMIPAIDNVAAAKGCSIIDLNTPFIGRNYLIPDGVHPNEEGAKDMAEIIYKAITCPACTDINPFIRLASRDLLDRRSSVSSNLEVSGSDLEKLFDKNPATGISTGFTNGNYIQVDFDTPVVASGYSVTVSQSDLTWWELWGNKVGEGWVKLDEYNSIVIPDHTTMIFQHSDWASAYTSFKLYFFGNTSSTLKLSEWQIFGHLQQFESCVTNTLGGTITSSMGASWEQEVVEKLIDGNISSKYCSNFGYAPIQIQYENPTAVSIDKYALTSANDALERSPKTWVLQGSDDGYEWTDLDSQQNQDFVGFFHTMEYSITPTSQYKYFRLNVSEYYSTTNAFQLAQFQLFETLASTRWTGSVDTGWNKSGNWTGGVPGTTTDVTIAANTSKNYPTVPSAKTIGKLTIEAGAELGGQDLLTFTDLTVNVKVPADRWNMLSLPLAAKVSDFKSIESDIWISKFDENGWNEIITGATTLGIGEGFILWVEPGNEEFSLTGTALAGASLTEPLAFTHDIDYDSDFALVGNPYLSSIDFTKLVALNGTLINDNYQIYTGTGNDDDDTDGQADASYIGYHPLGDWGLSVDDLDEFIAPFQSFIVEKNTANTAGDELAFTPTIMTGATGKGELRATGNITGKLEITATNPAASFVTFIANRENSRDAGRMSAGIGNIPDIYTLKGSKALGAHIIQTDDILIPLGIATVYEGNMTLTFKGMDTYNAQIKLIDNEKEGNKEIELTGSEFVYPFEYTPAKNTNDAVVANNTRFAIQFAPNALTGIKNKAVESNVSVYGKDKTIFVASSSSSDRIKGIYVYDTQGRTVYANDKVNTTAYAINQPFAASVYVVKVITEKGVKNVKVINN
ncbi:hypothetical protein FACS189413_05780 [Bacteroidia bacterium]|nr:hypothetical protein FACS189413_05780 [Bacteroidia bacterium]